MVKLGVRLPLEQEENELVKISNSAPVLALKPKDVAMWAGSKLAVQFDEPYDIENDSVTMTLDLGKAAEFAQFDNTTRQLLIDEGSTSNSTAGRYRMTLTLTAGDGENNIVGGVAKTTTSYSFFVYVKFNATGLSEEEYARSTTTKLVSADEFYTILPQTPYY